MPGDVRALPIAKWQTGSEGHWDKKSRQKLPQALSAKPAAGLGPSGVNNNLLKARLARIRIHRDSDLS